MLKYTFKNILFFIKKPKIINLFIIEFGIFLNAFLIKFLPKKKIT